MSEIERAIEFMYGERKKAASMYLKNTDERVVALIDRVVVYYDMAMQALRAELSRQENAPLTGGLQTIYYTPYSCEYCGDHIAVGWAFCPECGTPTKQKSYEPKGEIE